MPLPRLWLAALLLLAAAPVPLIAARNAAATVVVPAFGLDSVPLSGPWQFHPGDNAAWAAPDLDDSEWEQLSADKPWGAQSHPGYTGYAWYRLHLSVQQKTNSQKDTSLLVPPVGDVYAIYWNGREVARLGKFPPYPIWYRSSGQPTIYPVDLRGDGVLVMRVWKAPLLSDDSGELGGFTGPPMLGTLTALDASKDRIDFEWLRDHQLSFNVYLLYGIVGLLSLMTWLRSRDQKPLLWMTGFSLAPLIRLVLYGMHIPWPVAVSNALGEPFSSVRDICLWFLLLWLLRLDDQPALLRLTRSFAWISLAVTVLDGLPAIVDQSVSRFWIVQVADGLLTVAYFLTAALPLVLVACALTRRKQLDSARWLVAATAFLSGMVQVVLGMAPQGSRFTHWTLADTLDQPLLVLHGNGLNLRTLSGLLLLIAIVYAVYRISMENRRRQNLLEQEFSTAREVQLVLIPESLPVIPGFSVTSAYRPAQAVGGDFFQIVPLEDAHTLIVLGDVSGKGLKAAMSVSLVVGMIRALAKSSITPAGLLAELNRDLCGRLAGGFMTCIALRLSPDGTCVLSNAGHPAPYVNQLELEMAGALPLGLYPENAYEQTSVQLAPGDRLSLYTDGLPEARSQSGELYGFERTGALFAAGLDASQASESAVAFGQDDDITVVILSRMP